METTKITSLIISVLNETASEEQRRELEKWLSQEPKNRAFYDNIKNPRYVEQAIKTFAEYNSQQDWSSLKMKIATQNRKNKLRRQIRYTLSAASALVAAGLVIYTLVDRSNSRSVSIDEKAESIAQVMLISGDQVVPIDETVKNREITINQTKVAQKEGQISYRDFSDALRPENNTIIVPSRKLFTVELEDGTRVTLNANSKMTYPTRFDQKSRSVTVQGEAYFEVHKESRPFVVRVDESTIRVYGTTFNVSNNVKNEIRTTLLSGSIGFKPSRGNEVKMHPGELAILNTTNNRIEVKPADLTKTTAWQNQFIYSHNDNVSVLLSDIAVWYGVTFIYDESDFKSDKVSATFDKSLELEHVLEPLEDILNVRFIRKETTRYEVIRK